MNANSKRNSEVPKNTGKNSVFWKNEAPSNSDFREKVTNMERAHPPETLNTISRWAYSQNVAARRPQHRNKLNSIGICAWGPEASQKAYIAIGTWAFLRRSAKPTEGRPKTRQKGRNRRYLRALLGKTGVVLRAREKTQGFSQKINAPVQFNIVQNPGPKRALYKHIYSSSYLKTVGGSTFTQPTGTADY